MKIACECCDNEMVDFFKKDKANYQKCSACGLIRIYPQPSDEVLAEIYRRDYYKIWGGKEEIFGEAKIKTANALLDLLPKNADKSQLLDVGAATGIMMQAAQEKGYEVYGVELSEDGGAAITEKFGAEKIIQQDFCAFDFATKFTTGKFDVIVMADFLEHVRDPNATLQRAHNLLKKGGHLLILCPTTNSLSYKLSRTRWTLFMPEHLFSFSHKNLKMLVEKNKFKIINHRKNFMKYLSIEFIRSFLSIHNYGLSAKFAFILKMFPKKISMIPIKLPAGSMAVVCKMVNG